LKILFLQNCQVEGPGLLAKYMADRRFEFDIFPAYSDRKFPAIESFSAFFIGGTPLSVNRIHEHHFLQKEWNYLQKVLKLHKPCLGICFGAQLLAKLLGAAVTRSPVLEIGGYEVQLTPAGRKHKFFQEFPETFPVFQWHGETFGIPPGARLLVEGRDCKNQAFSYKNVLAIQFHLEVTTSEADKWASRYKDELRLVNKTKTRVVNQCKRKEVEMKRLAYLLLDNFFQSLESRSDNT
jgi:GMP synthase-like glutamine amidotransferase